MTKEKLPRELSATGGPPDPAPPTGSAHDRDSTALRASETRYRRLFESAQDGILILDADTGRVVDVNPFLTELLGMTRERFLDKAVWELGFMKDVVANMDKFTELQRQEYIRYENLPLECADGRKVHVEFVSNVYLADNHKVIQCNIRDITERKRTEEELIRLRQAVHASSDAIFMTDAEGVFTFVNEGFTRLYGYTAEDVVGKTTPRILKGGEQPREFYEAFWRSILDKQPVNRELANKTKDGRSVTMEVTANAILDDAGRIVGFLAIQRDITDRKRAEQALRQSEAFNRSLIAHLPQRVFLKDRSSTYLSCNANYSMDLGVSPEEIVGKDDFAFHPRDVAEAYRVDDQLVMSSGHPRRIEEPYVVAGERRWISTTKVPYHDDRGRVVGVLGIFEDITERRRGEEAKAKLEEQLRVSQKMEAIGSLAGGIAHDFNNLLSVILAYTGFAIDGVREGDPLRDDLLEVKQAGERAAVLTHQLLAFSRRQVLQPRSLDLNEVVTGIEKMLRRIIGEDIDLQPILAPDLGPTLADHGQIEQVLMNLIVNARDAMPTGGTITIETANVDLDEDFVAQHAMAKPGPHVLLAITDTGCGMDRQTQARVFEPFFTTKEKGKGTGLGLSTVYGIVKQSGGDIWVYSEPGQGTVFKIYLPRAAAAGAPHVLTPAVMTHAAGTETILVAEDEAAVRNLAKRILAAAGYTVLSAANGGEALLICEEHPGKIDLLLTDVIMPRMSGMALSDRLAQVSPEMKVLYMSGYTDGVMDQDSALGQGTPFIAKPFNAADLTRKVREALDGHRSATAADPADPGGSGT